MSRYPGPENNDPFSPLLPPRSPGSLGKRDAADPDTRVHLGDTPGPVGVNDGAASCAHGGRPTVLRMAQQLVLAAAATATPIMKSSSPSLSESDIWFENVVIPMRTASSGLSLNRIWKTPRAVLKGNTEDPNGLCGDASAYVYEQFYADFKDYGTKDAFHIGLILWEGYIDNHMANIMLLKAKKAVQKYKWDTAKKEIVSVSGTPQYKTAELLTLHVYDLYYKKKTNVEAWWKERNTGNGGTIKLGFPYNIEET